MSETIKEMIRFLVESFQTYTDGNKIWLLYPLALVAIFFLGRKEDRKLFWGSLAVQCLTIFNPLFIWIFLKVFGFENRYLRFFWMLVFFITIAYAMDLMIFHFKKKAARICAGAVMAALILFLGTPVFWGKNAFPYEAAQNSWFTDQTVLELANMLHSEGLEKPKVLYGRELLDYCQYDPSVSSVLSRYSLMTLESNSLEEFLELENASRFSKEIYRVFYYEDFCVPADRFCQDLRKLEVDYVVSDSERLDEYLEDSSMSVLGVTSKYRVWKVS